MYVSDTQPVAMSGPAGWMTAPTDDDTDVRIFSGSQPSAATRLMPWIANCGVAISMNTSAPESLTWLTWCRSSRRWSRR